MSYQGLQFSLACTFMDSDQKFTRHILDNKNMQKFFMQTTKTDQSVQMYRLICVFVGYVNQMVHYLTLSYISVNCIMVPASYFFSLSIMHR